MIGQYILGDLLRNTRLSRSLSVTEMTRLIGVRYGSVARWEASEGFPKDSEIGNISHHYGILEADVRKAVDHDKEIREQEKLARRTTRPKFNHDCVSWSGSGRTYMSRRF